MGEKREEILFSVSCFVLAVLKKFKKLTTYVTNRYVRERKQCIYYQTPIGVGSMKITTILRQKKKLEKCEKNHKTFVKM
jgi:hypothetical protein